MNSKLKEQYATSHLFGSNAGYMEDLYDIPTSFAEDGDPNHEGIPTWHPYTSEVPAMMVFGLETYSSPPLKTLSIWKNER